VDSDEFVNFYMKILSNGADDERFKAGISKMRLTATEARRRFEASAGGWRRTTLVELHQLLDLDGDGVISAEEFQEFGITLDPMGWSDAKTKRAIASMDADKNGSVDEAEFVQFYLKINQDKADDQFIEGIKKMKDTANKARELYKERGLKKRRSALTALHRMLDLDSDGVVSRAEFAEFGRSLDPGGWSDDKTRLVLQKMDRDRSGDVDKDEFVDFYMETLANSSDKTVQDGMTKMREAAAKTRQRLNMRNW